MIDEEFRQEECQQLNISDCLETAIAKDCLVRHDEENPIKSVATVKYQMVQSPANFARLKCNTDLNVPPTNWLNSAFNSYGFQQALSQSTGFSSFRMAHLFPDCLSEVDVVANADNIKSLLKLPYASNCSISMMVHRIGNTLLIDDFDVHRFLLQQEDCNWHWLRSFICEHILTRLNDTERNFLDKQPTTSRSDAAVQQRSLLSKFLYHSLSTSTVGKADLNDALDIKLADQSTNHLQYGPLLPDPSVEENVPDPKHTKHTYNRNVIWTFEDIRMLIGTDMAIFGGASRPCISLRLRDMRQPINVLTGIDYWLDNLMCNVPEVVMCYHLDGLVQNYEIIKTEDLPFLENSKFQPNTIRNVAQNILSFLKQNATKPGHTYWLFKGRKDDVVKLYDLTSLTATNEFGGQAKRPTNDKKINEDDDDDTSQEDIARSDDKNPFTVPVAMLLYKVARNMKNSREHIKAKQAGSIKALLDNCIKLLPKEQYPQIVASSYYLLSDLHIPSGTDPMSPKFDNDANATKDCSDDDDNNGSDDSGSTSGGDYQQQQQRQSQECTTKKLWNESSNSLPSPLIGSVDERCSSALQYIADGLNCLQYFSMNEAKLAKEREEIERQTERMRIIQEEQNPNMAKPYQAIPLKYEKIRRNFELETIATTPSSLMSCTNQIEYKMSGSSTRENDQQKSKEEPSTSTKDNQLFVNKPRPPKVQSWNDHLKLLFFEKSCLIYAILTEQAYQRKEYGNALKYISIAMNYFDVVSMHQSYCMSVGDNYRTNLLARAGDCYFKCAQEFQNINTHLNDYNRRRDIDVQIEKELEKDESELTGDDEKCGGAIRLIKPFANLEQLILIGISYYETALKYTDGKDSRDEILGRIGSVLNELGIKYMNWSQEQSQKIHNDAASNSNDNDANDVSDSESSFLKLAMKSYDCFIRGIAIFDEINDNANLAILLGNMGRFMRFRAHLERDKGIAYKKLCYENAFASYERALTILESKKRNPCLWDFVNSELSSAKFTLAKYMQQMYESKENDEIDQEIIELLLGSLKLCDTETPGPKQIVYTIRTGLIYHKLAIIYSRQYRTTNNSNNRKKKLLNLCRLYYEKSFKVFQNIEAPTEFIEVQIDRLKFQSTLFEGFQTASQKLKCLQTAVSIACETVDQFEKIGELDVTKDDPKFNVEILKQFELSLQTILKHLIQVSINKHSDTSSIAEYKRLYSLSLQSSAQKEDFLQFSSHLKNLLQAIQQSVVISC